MTRDELQAEDVHRIRASIGNGSKAPLFVAPCGYGKTTIMSILIERARQRCRSALILSPRRELVHQVQGRLDSVGVEYGTIMAGEEPSLMPSVQIASVATLHRRAIMADKIEMPHADCVIVDESHEGTFGQCKDVLDYYRNRGAVIVGLTATPARPSDGRGLGEVYDDMVLGPSIGDLIRMGHLVQPIHFRGQGPDLEGVTVRDDYVQKELVKRVRDPVLIGAVVANWFRLASDRKTLVFAHHRAHARDLCDEFLSHGVAAGYVDANTPIDERRAIHDRFAGDETQLLVNVGIYTYGVDIPQISAIVMATPTKSIVKSLQCAGRGLRIAPGKMDCYILDHGNCTKDCGFVDDEQPWTLDGRKKIQEERKLKARQEPKEVACPECDATFRAAPTCPQCGHSMGSAYKKAIVELDADLTEVDRKTRKANGRKWSIGEKRRFFGELRGVARQRQRKDGWCVRAYQQKVGVLPWPVYDEPAREPSKETLAWVRYLDIRYAKSRRAA